MKRYSAGSDPTGAPRTADGPVLQRAGIVRAAAGIAVYAGVFGTTFGAVAAAAGLNVPDIMLLSVVMFTGASQFAFVGVVAAGGSLPAAVLAALLLGIRNAFYGVPVTAVVRPRGLSRFWTAHFVIDETAGMTVAQSTRPAARYAFWVTGRLLFVCWVAGSLVGALAGSHINSSQFGLDAAAPAIFLALLWPQLTRAGIPAVASVGALIAFALIPITPPGIPVVAAATVAVASGFIGRRGRPQSAGMNGRSNGSE
jgi:4-azaleucine resistance transporter AzlC